MNASFFEMEKNSSSGSSMGLVLTFDDDDVRR